MKLLIITQSVDRKNTVLGFFHRWIEEFSKNFESIVVICLEKGEYDLPKNVKVLSLGKEKSKVQSLKSKVKYILNFYKYIWSERKNYDAVFMHMNEEYVILGWKLWLLLGKKIYMWRNHHKGTLFTDIASFFCHKIFCTSKFSYTAKFKKTVIMPVGIDVEKFQVKTESVKVKNSIFFLGRIAPVKKPHLLIEVLGRLKEKGIIFSASFYGDASPEHNSYHETLVSRVKELGLSEQVTFYKGVPNDETPEIYNAHEIFVNLSSSGMYDKTIFEAMACGTLVLASNKNLEGQIDSKFIFREGDKDELEKKLVTLIKEGNQNDVNDLREYVILNHSLSRLAKKLCIELK